MHGNDKHLIRVSGFILAIEINMPRSILCSFGVALVFQCLGQEPVTLPLVNPDTILQHFFPEVEALSEAYQPGERLEYDFSYGLLDAAKAEIQLTELPPGEHGPRWHIDARGNSTGTFSWFFKVDDHYQTTLDARTGLPLQFVRNIHEGGYTLHQTYDFNWRKNTVQTTSSKRGNPAIESAFLLPGPTHDMISSIYALRHAHFEELQIGDTLRIPTFMDEERFELKVIYAGEARPKVDGVRWDCLLFHPIIQTGRIWKNPDDLAVYISNDANRIPVLAKTRILFGTVKMELTNASGLRNPSARRD